MLKKIVLLLGFCILFPISVLAHKALFFAYLDEQQIICEGSFSGGRVCKDCAVTVYDAASNQLVVQGKTDSTGKCRFPLSQAILQAQSGLNLFLDGGAGHRAKWFLEPDEYLDFVPKKETSTPSAVAKVDQNHLLSINNEEKNSVNGETIRCIVAEEVARVLDKKLAPLRRNLALALNPKPSIADIAGGVGWIVGLAGIIAWLRARRKI